VLDKSASKMHLHYWS